VFACAGKTVLPSRLISRRPRQEVLSFSRRNGWPRVESSTTSQHGPGDACELVGERDSEHVAVRPLLGRLDPALEISPSSATEESWLLRAAPIRAGERRKKCATRTAKPSTQRLSVVRRCTSARAWAALWRVVLSPSALSTSVRLPIRSAKQNRPSEASGLLTHPPHG
jgi:hypothetical protein